MKTYILHWLTGQTEEVHGTFISDAFRRAGYGGGAINALDYHEEKKPEKPKREKRQYSRAERTAYRKGREEVELDKPKDLTQFSKMNPMVKKSYLAGRRQGELDKYFALGWDDEFRAEEYGRKYDDKAIQSAYNAGRHKCRETYALDEEED